MDTLLSRLRDSPNGCHIGPYYYGSVMYADDLCLLAPSSAALKNMVKICEDFADEFNVKFNGNKSYVIYFSRKGSTAMSPAIRVNGQHVQYKNEVVHLGNRIFNNITHDNLDDVMYSFFKQYNLFKCKFRNVPTHVKNKLFLSYCTSFYGITLCNLSKIDKLLVGVRKCFRDVWGLPYRTHNRLLPYIAGNLCELHIFIKRFVRFAHDVLNHSAECIKYLFRLTANGSFSIFGLNMRYIASVCNVRYVDFCTKSCQFLLNLIRIDCYNTHHADVCCRANAEVIKELIMAKDGYLSMPLNHDDICNLLNMICLN